MRGLRDRLRLRLRDLRRVVWVVFGISIFLGIAATIDSWVRLATFDSKDFQVLYSYKLKDYSMAPFYEVLNEGNLYGARLIEELHELPSDISKASTRSMITLWAKITEGFHGGVSELNGARQIAPEVDQAIRITASGLRDLWQRIGAEVQGLKFWRKVILSQRAGPLYGTSFLNFAIPTTIGAVVIFCAAMFANRSYTGSG